MFSRTSCSFGGFCFHLKNLKQKNKAFEKYVCFSLAEPWSLILKNDGKWLTFEIFGTSNHHCAKISVMWLVERSAIKLLVLMRYEIQRIVNANTTLVALFEIHFRSLFLDIEKKKTMQWSYGNTVRSFITDLFKRDVFRLYHDWNKLMINH